jgi:hypothetical protein
MSQKVWCVFQRLPGESCPALSAVCASREVAGEVARMSAEDDRRQERAPSAWTIAAWGVLDGDVAELQGVQQISGSLDNMRAGAIPADEAEEAPAGPAAGAEA